MGRGRARGKGRARGGVGRGKSSRGGHKEKGHGFSRKESTHLRQFGEQHPSENMGEFQPKKFKFDEPTERDRKGFRGRGRGSLSAVLPAEESSESESEDEATPYSEMLDLFVGQTKKKDVRIDSESDTEEEDETLVEQPGSEGSGNNLRDQMLESESDSGAESESKDDEALLKKQNIRNTESTDHGNMDSAGNSDDEQDQVDLEEETVIEEAELDPEINDEEKSLRQVDPFLLHFEREFRSDMKEFMEQDDKLYSYQKEFTWPMIGRCQYNGISKEKWSNDRSTDAEAVASGTIDLSAVMNSRIVEDPGHPPSACPKLQTDSNIFETFFIRKLLQQNISGANKACTDKTNSSNCLTRFQSEILSLISQYYDLYMPQRSLENEDEIRLVYCIHATNHILKTRTRIIHHNARMSEKVDVPEEFRDQGFVRPKILILTPFKATALKIVNNLISLILPHDGTVQNKRRFTAEYGGESLFMPKTNPKPYDYICTFAGNVDDNFKIGLAVTKKSVKLYTGFYSSDIIVASPLGLRLIIGAEGEKNRDYDFLSSIEIFIADQADVFLMQNWDHVLHLVRHLHRQPVTTHGTDFARIRPWALDSLTRNYCQSLVFSSITCPELNALFARYFKNYAGLVKVINPVTKASISQIANQLPQVFQQFDCPSLQEATDARFKYFVEKVLPNFTEKLMSHTLIFVSSYFDFVRLRNYFKREKVSFVQICEYTKDKKIARARDYFFHGQSHFILYTERAHFFKRFRLKGIGHVIFYQLPHYAHFYSEICNLMQEEYQIRRVRQRRNNSVNVIYCKYDAPRLAPIVGTVRANYMLSSEKAIHAFVSSSDVRSD